jgi:hypothetical protein
MTCLYCNTEHNGTYGSGKFCSKKCACGFSTKDKRKEINEKVRLKSLEKGNAQVERLQSPDVRERRAATMLEKYGTLFYVPIELRKQNGEKIKELRLKQYQEKEFEELSLTQKKRRLIEIRGYKCEWCGISSWRNERIVIELDHINGCKNDNTPENLRLLCPNCHSQTPTWKTRNLKNKNND